MHIEAFQELPHRIFYVKACTKDGITIYNNLHNTIFTMANVTRTVK